MRLVIDSNRLFAALIKQGTCRTILFSSKFEFFAPLEITGEVAKYRVELISKAKIDPSQFAKVLDVLMSRVQQTSLDDFPEAEQTATKLMAAVDPKDAPFLAVGIALHCDGIWSEDGHFSKQTQLKQYTTRKLLTLMAEESQSVDDERPDTKE